MAISEGSTIRLDLRAQDVWENPGTPDRNDKRQRIREEIALAKMVIDAQDTVIKAPVGQVPRPATMDDIKESRLVQG